MSNEVFSGHQIDHENGREDGQQQQKPGQKGDQKSSTKVTPNPSQAIIQLNSGNGFYCPNTKEWNCCEMCRLVVNLATLAKKFRNDVEMAKLAEELLEYVEPLCSEVTKLTPHLSRYDFSETVQANGYRSFVWETQCAVTACLRLVMELNEEKGQAKAAGLHALEKLHDWKNVFRILLTLINCLVIVVESSERSDSLFTSSEAELSKLSSMAHDKGIAGFHGRLLGFQFCKSMREALTLVTNLMAAFSHVYETEILMQSIKGSFVTSKSYLNYMLNPSSRAKRIQHVINEDSLNFLSRFWLIPESGVSKVFFSLIGENLQTNIEIKVPPTRLAVPTKFGSELTILPPDEYLGLKPIDIRLIAHKKIEMGLIGDRANNNMANISNSLIFHCHGGGFVSQSSNTHLTYLRTWARLLPDCPIVSVDYSLSPEAPYPRALHEVFYAYLWCLENSHILGSTAQNVVFVGDSAGGQLLCGVIILCVELGLRIPDGFLLAYAPLIMETAISPARLLSLADPLLPYTALAACCKAYLGENFDPSLANLPQSFVEGDWEWQHTNLEQCTRKFVALKGLKAFEGVNAPPDDFHLSPLIAPDALLAKFPPTAVVSTVFDPCLDDCVEFAKRLKAVGVPTTMDVLNSLPHGFLNFGTVSEESANGIETCFRLLKNFVPG